MHVRIIETFVVGYGEHVQIYDINLPRQVNTQRFKVIDTVSSVRWDTKMNR